MADVGKRIAVPHYIDRRATYVVWKDPDPTVRLFGASIGSIDKKQYVVETANLRQPFTGFLEDIPKVFGPLREAIVNAKVASVFPALR